MSEHPEIWRTVDGRPGYEVSNLGRVRSLDRTIPHNGDPSTPRRLRGRVLRQNPNRAVDGYLSVMLGAGHRVYVHRLVAAAFIGPIDGCDVDHLDNDPTNNRADNLQVVTHAENLAAMSERRTHCTNGHDLADVGTTSSGKSRRRCRACQTQWEFEKRTSRKEPA